MPAYDIVGSLDEAEEYEHLTAQEQRGLLRAFADTHGPTVPYPMYPAQQAIALDWDGAEIIGILLTPEGSEELYLWVHEAYRRQGIGTALVKHHGSGYAVAGSEAGLSFLYALHNRLTEDEREFFDVPCWYIFTDRE